MAVIIALQAIESSMELEPVIMAIQVPWNFQLLQSNNNRHQVAMVPYVPWYLKPFSAITSRLTLLQCRHALVLRCVSNYGDSSSMELAAPAKQ